MTTNQQRREAAKRKLAAQQEHRAERAAKRKRTSTIAAVATVVVVALLAVGVYAVTQTWNSGDNPQAAAAPAPGSDCSYPAEANPAKPVHAPENGPAPTQGTVPVALSTSAGPIDLTLDRAKAPCTVKSFESLVQQKYFDATSCHRMTTTPGLQVLQCGDPTGQGTGGPGYTIPDEVTPDQTYQRGQLAMAKTSAPNSGGSQFFMIYGDAQLPPEYTVFGTIGAQGLQTVDKVAKGGVQGGGEDGPPATKVEIQTATLGS